MRPKRPASFADGEARDQYVAELRAHTLDEWEKYSAATITARQLAREAADALARFRELSAQAEAWEARRAETRQEALACERELGDLAHKLVRMSYGGG